MRQLGLHLIMNELNQCVNACGYCGLSDCSVVIKISSGQGKNANRAPHSNCGYYVKFSLGADVNSSKNTPGTNRPIECPQCKLVIWSYNLKKHFDLKHQDLDFPLNKRNRNCSC